MVKTGKIADLFDWDAIGYALENGIREAILNPPQIIAGAEVYTPKQLPSNCTRGVDGIIWHWNNSDYKAQVMQGACLYG